jgi:t-SNARE complex subunit (syntaxin)
MHGTLTKKFLDLMQEYQEVQTKYKNKFRERVERQYKIVKPDATQEEIDAALESGNTEVFANQILDTKRHEMAKDALAYIENKHKDILRLEQSIQELHQLFLDMAILVEAQGELIDQIEFNVSQSVAFTRDAVTQLQKANKEQKKSRKKMCCIIVILLVVLAILAGIGGIIGGIFSSA